MLNSCLNLDSEVSYSVPNEESFEENYEEMINSYLHQRHIYSASLPLPVTTESIIDQIQSENHSKIQQKILTNFQIRQQLLSLINPTPSKSNFLPKLIIENTENYENMREIAEVTSSAEQSPSGAKSAYSEFDYFWMDRLETDEVGDISAEISQEIK